MKANKSLTKESIKEILKTVSYNSIQSWLKDRELSFSAKDIDDFADKLYEKITAEDISIDQFNQAVGEIEENGGKKVYLKIGRNTKDIIKKKDSYLKKWAQMNITPSDENYIRMKSSNKPKFNYLYWDEENVIKVKYSEINYDVEFDPDEEKIIKIEKVINIVFVVDCKSGLAQIKFDKPGNKHAHKNAENKSSEESYEEFYKNLFEKIFEGIFFENISLADVANYIAENEKTKYRINREVTTITDNAKQIFTSSSRSADVRSLPEHVAAAAVGKLTWLTEDLTGYWIASTSSNELNRDLFMRISRKFSQIRVQRDCLEKEMNYGIKQIREIQKKIQGI